MYTSFYERLYRIKLIFASSLLFSPSPFLSLRPLVNQVHSIRSSLIMYYACLNPQSPAIPNAGSKDAAFLHPKTLIVSPNERSGVTPLWIYANQYVRRDHLVQCLLRTIQSPPRLSMECQPLSGQILRLSGPHRLSTRLTLSIL